MSRQKKSEREKGLLLIAIFADAGCFVVFCTVIIWTVIESAVLLSDWPSPTLVLKVPVKASKRLVLGTLMLNKQWTLLYTKLFQIPSEGMRKKGRGGREVKRKRRDMN